MDKFINKNNEYDKIITLFSEQNIRHFIFLKNGIFYNLLLLIELLILFTVFFHFTLSCNSEIKIFN